ncbi:hypothetical protein LTR17_005343 [Elasticomyces elasticus]|nr:hypothetical protein LTR17_005343 [Elasticomyces elasticus]
MSRTTVIDIPLGDHAGKCTIEVPIAAAASTEHSKTISTITEDITSSIYRATTHAAQQPVEGDNPRKRQRQDGNDEDEPMPVLDPNAEPDAPDAERWVDFIIRDCHGNRTNCSVMEHDPLDSHFVAYATLKGMGREIFRFLFDGERIMDGYSAASISLENGDVIEVFQEFVGS